jgi:hypothetical protein
MNALTDLEYRILDELYFISSYQTLVENLSEEKENIRQAIENMLVNGWIIQIKYEHENEKKLEMPDFSALEQSYFVASKKGLLIHNSRN